MPCLNTPMPLSASCQQCSQSSAQRQSARLQHPDSPLPTPKLRDIHKACASLLLAVRSYMLLTASLAQGRKNSLENPEEGACNVCHTPPLNQTQ